MQDDSTLCREGSAGEPVEYEAEIPYQGIGSRFMRVAYLPDRDSQGNVVGWIASIVDMTDRKRAEDALLQREQELQNLNQQLEQRVEERTVELAQQAVQLRALAGELTLAEQRERRRMAKVLHDHLQQLLVGAKFRVAILGRHDDPVVQQATQEIEQLLDDAISASRSLTAELSPPILYDGGLAAGLEWLARWMADKHGLIVTLSMEGGSPPLARDVQVLLFESVRELLFNAVKHAHVRSVDRQFSADRR